MLYINSIYHDVAAKLWPNSSTSAVNKIPIAYKIPPVNTSTVNAAATIVHPYPPSGGENGLEGDPAVCSLFRSLLCVSNGFEGLESEILADDDLLGFSLVFALCSVLLCVSAGFEGLESEGTAAGPLVFSWVSSGF